MSPGLAKLVLTGALVYTVLGVVFAVFFLFLARGVQRIDPSAAGASFGFRVLVAPGTVALWPLLLRKWLRGQTRPPDSYTAHDRAAKIRKLP